MRSLAATQIRSDIDVTPLVDVVLVLLIIFMVITPLLQVGYDVTVPKSERDPVAQPEDQIVVALKSDGSVSLNRQAIAKNLLAARLVSILSARSSKTVFFSVTTRFNTEERSR